MSQIPMIYAGKHMVETFPSVTTNFKANASIFEILTALPT